MTLAQVDAIRQRLIDALAAVSLNTMDHSIGDASYSPDGHLKTLQEQLAYWNKIYDAKSMAGRRFRITQKAV